MTLSHLGRAVANVIVALSGLALVSGCAGIPTSGLVRSSDLPVVEAGQVYVKADGPSVEASALDIAQGFVKAQAAGVYDDYRVAREFLTPAAAAAWDPSERTSVYLGEPTMAVSDGQVEGESPGGSSAVPSLNPKAGSVADGTAVVISGTVGLAATLDASGVFTEVAADAARDLTFTVVAVNGQWRINELDNGTLLSLPNFTSTYRSVSLAFLSPDLRYVVPDQRWYPLRNLATYAVEGLLAGPASWLQDSVTTAVPQGTTLQISGSVPIGPDGQATVDLSTPALSADTGQRALLQAQLESTLLQVPQVRGVTVQSGGADMGVTTAAQLLDDPVSSDPPTLVKGTALGTMDGSDFVATEGFAALAGNSVTALAVEPADGVHGGRFAVVREGSRSLVTVGVTGEGATPSSQLWEGHGVAAPSIDRYGWVWSASGSRIVVVDDAGATVTVSVPWLTGRTVLAVRVAHDGARIAIVSQDASSGRAALHVDIAGIVRDDLGAPTQVTTPIPVGAPLTEASEVVWVDASSIAVLGRSAASAAVVVHLVPLADLTATQPSADRISAVAAGWGVRSLVILSADGALFSRSGTGASWQPVTSGISAVAYPG